MMAETNNTPPNTAEELLRRYGLGEREFPNLDLDAPYLAEVVLAGAIFDGSWFTDGNFDRADLRGASFRNCNLKCANFRGADVRGAVFEGSALEATDWHGARIEGASFEGAGLYGYTVRRGDGFPDTQL